MKSIFPDFNPIVAAGKIAFNSYIGAPVTLAFDALKAIGGMLPKDSLENSITRSIAAELTAEKDYGYNMQSGNLGQDPFGRNPVSAFGNYEQTLAEDATYVGDSNFSNAKKQYAEDYFNAKAEKASGVDMEDGTVVGPGEMPVTQDEIDAFNEPTQEEKDAATAASNKASVELGAARYGDGGPGGTTSTSTVDDFDDGTMTGVAAPTTSPNPIDSFFDGVDNAAGGAGPSTTSGSLSQAQSTANIDAARGGNTGSTSGSLSQAQSTANIDAARGGGGGSSSGGKGIVCTMMNDFYGFGSFRNKIWLEHSKSLAPEYQKGYHKIFLPLVAYARKNGVTNKIVRKTLEHIAVHRTIDIRQEARGKTHLLGRVYRKILEPICYIVGKYAK